MEAAAAGFRQPGQAYDIDTAKMAIQQHQDIKKCKHEKDIRSLNDTCSGHHLPRLGGNTRFRKIKSMKQLNNFFCVFQLFLNHQCRA